MSRALIATVIVLFDVLTALSLVMVWIWRDATAQGRSLWPWILATLALGSFGPLLYLLTRPQAAPAEADG